MRSARLPLLHLSMHLETGGRQRSGGGHARAGAVLHNTNDALSCTLLCAPGEWFVCGPPLLHPTRTTPPALLPPIERERKGAVEAALEALRYGTCNINSHPTHTPHPQTEREHKGAVEAALEALRYGTVSLNTWSVIGYMVMPGHWGGFQGGQTLKVGTAGYCQRYGYVMSTWSVIGFKVMPSH